LDGQDKRSNSWFYPVHPVNPVHPVGMKTRQDIQDKLDIQDKDQIHGFILNIINSCPSCGYENLTGYTGLIGWAGSRSNSWFYPEYH
jgi:hypothetical protein